MKAIFSTEQWLTIIGGLIAAVAFGFLTFETKANVATTAEALSKEETIRRELIFQRFDRLENKVDEIYKMIWEKQK